MEEHKYIDFLRKHWSKLLLGILAVATLAVWGERFFRTNRSESQQDFLIANQIFERFQKGEPLAIESIESAERILKRHPELAPKYNVMLAMTYLAARNTTKGLPFVEAAISEAPPFYQNYAKTSLLVAEKRYQEAYKEAQDLQIALQNQGEHSTLYAFNLLRLVSLEQELETTSTAWEELKAHPAYPTIKPLFQEGRLSLEELLN